MTFQNMKIADRLLPYLSCPEDGTGLIHTPHGFLCPTCYRDYPVDGGIVRFIISKHERPKNPAALAADYSENSPERLEVSYYRERFAAKQVELEENAAVRKAVDFCANINGIIVDIATGHGGGYVPWLSLLAAKDALLVATDACPPVIENWYSLLSAQTGRFAFLDIDLARNLCFRDSAIDLITGVGIDNVNVNKPLSLFLEIYRCLKPGAWMVIHQIFYSSNSHTAAFLKAQENPYESISSYSDLLGRLGLRLMDADEAGKFRGKIDPGDGFPIDEDDSWAEMILYIRKD